MSHPSVASEAAGATFVLVHGAWHGGWCWRDVVAGLAAAGHRAFAPTLTGLGQSRHLLAGDVTLDTCVADVAGLIEAEELSGVVLVGHSFGGAVISGVADRLGPRLRHLVYLDALVIPGGARPFDAVPPAVAAERRRRIAEEGGGIALPVPPVSAFGIPEDHPSAAWVRRRLTPHPAGTYESPLRLAHPLGNGLPRTYVHCTDPSYAPLADVRRWVRSQPGWAWAEIAAGHDAMVTAPEPLTRLLAGFA
ncbi:alpha/beta fold hydrolase [Methylobacterium sp. A54F]